MWGAGGGGLRRTCFLFESCSAGGGGAPACPPASPPASESLRSPARPPAGQPGQASASPWETAAPFFPAPALSPAWWPPTLLIAHTASGPSGSRATQSSGFLRGPEARGAFRAEFGGFAGWKLANLGNLPLLPSRPLLLPPPHAHPHTHAHTPLPINQGGEARPRTEPLTRRERDLEAHRPGCELRLRHFVAL